MKRPSRGFLVAGFLLLVVVGVLLNRWLELRKPNRWAAAPAPDVWVCDGAPEDLRSSPDGPPSEGWVYDGMGSFKIGGRDERPFLVLVKKGQESPNWLQRALDRASGDPMRSWKNRETRNLHRADDPAVVKTTGSWVRYTSRWWKGATPPAGGK